jgi:hypothetical protein
MVSHPKTPTVALRDSLAPRCAAGGGHDRALLLLREPRGPTGALRASRLAGQAPPRTTAARRAALDAGAGCSGDGAAAGTPAQLKSLLCMSRLS